MVDILAGIHPFSSSMYVTFGLVYKSLSRHQVLLTLGTFPWYSLPPAKVRAFACVDLA